MKINILLYIYKLCNNSGSFGHQNNYLLLPLKFKIRMNSKYARQNCESVAYEEVCVSTGCQHLFFISLIFYIVTLGARNSHEEQCEFVPIPCPNLNNTCGKFRKSELEEHLKVCVFTPCRHQYKGRNCKSPKL